MRTEIFLVFLGLVLLASGCLTPAQEEEQDSASTFGSEQEFLDYMEQPSLDQGEISRSTDLSYGVAEETDELAREVEEDVMAEGNAVETAEWIQTTEDRIFISHRYPRHFQSVQTPSLEIEHNISEAGGPTLVSGEKIVVEEQERIVAYNEEMGEEWSIGLESQVQEMKLSDDKVILLTRETDAECPLRPVYGIDINCSSIIRPVYPGQTDYTYTLMTLDIENGDELDSMSFVASSRTQVEVTSEETFISYSDRTPDHEILSDFLLNEASLNPETRERVEELQKFDLTPRSMEIELETAVNRYESDNMQALEEEFESYDRENFRSYEESTLLVIDNGNLTYDEQRFDGRITDIDSGRETLLTVDFNGVQFDNRESEIKLLGGGSRTIDGEAQLFNRSILLREQDQISVLDLEMNEKNSADISALMMETAGDRILVSERTDQGTELVLFDSDLQELDSHTMDTGLYRADLVGKETLYALTYSYNGNVLLQITDEIDTHETEASGTLVYSNSLYTVSDKVQEISEEGEIMKEIELEIPRMVRPLPEPVEEPAR